MASSRVRRQWEQAMEIAADTFRIDEWKSYTCELCGETFGTTG